MDFIVLLAAGGAGDSIDPTQITGLSLKTALWTWGIFLVVLIVLWKFAWGPIVAALNDREARINESLEKAAEIEKATAAMAETNRQMLEEAQRDAQGIVAEARQTAKVAAEEMTAKAAEEIEAQRERAKRELALESDKARADLRADAVDLTILAASKLIGRNLSGDDHRRLADEALSDAEQAARN